MRVFNRGVMSPQGSRLRLTAMIAAFLLIGGLGTWRIYLSADSSELLPAKSVVASLPARSALTSLPATLHLASLPPKSAQASKSPSPSRSRSSSPAGSVSANGAGTVTGMGNTSGLAWKSGVSFPNVDAYSNAAANATSAFGTWRGKPVEVAVVWPQRGSWASFTRPSTFYANWAKQSYTKVITLPPFPANIGDTITGCIAGDYDSYWRTFAHTMENSHLAAEGSIIRLGWEMNEHTDWGTPSQFAACWRNIVSTVNAIAPGLLWDWNVNRGPGGYMPGASILNAYPGNAYVNIVGVDSYDDWPPVNTSGGWQQQLNGPYGLNYWLSFAKNHGKMFSVPEWGVGEIGTWNGHSGGDDPSYIKDMYGFFTANSGNLEFESYFNGGGDSIYDPTQNPSSAAEYSRLF